MKKIIFLITVFSITIFSCKSEKTDTNKIENTTEETTGTNKIVSLNGAITETIAALGVSNQIVGKDVTSTFPADITAPELGHVRSMTIEPIMSVSPNLILASEKDINPDLMTKVKESKIKMTLVKQEYSVDGAKNLIKQVAEAIGQTSYQSLIDKIDTDLLEVKPIQTKPKVLFIYARGTGNIMVAGQNTPMDALISMAGGQNAITGFDNFKPLTPEAVVQGNPDVILMFDSGIQSLGGIDRVLKTPGIEQTNAGKNKKVITMDGALISNFGPRTGEAIIELNKLLVDSAK